MNWTKVQCLFINKHRYMWRYLSLYDGRRPMGVGTFMWVLGTVP